MNGFVIWRGPSEIDGSPIVAIAIGVLDGGSNSKTGPMAQIYILREDMNPIEAIQRGEDAAICGSCRHRGKVERDRKTGHLTNVGRSCYVVAFHGPRVVWDALQRGAYQQVPLARAKRLLARRRVRVGAYGDPGAVPLHVWQTVLASVDENTGYTHLWREYPGLADFCMASCDSEDERIEAKALGFRTFRVRGTNDPVMKGEGQCPASEEMGKAVQCAQCMLCGGQRTSAKADLTIQVHGSGRRHFALA